MKTKTLIKCLAGSHLYGLSTPESDIDYYEVYDYFNKRYRPNKQAKQTIVDNEDSTQVSLNKFHFMCMKGVPQALETLFSPQDAWLEVSGEWVDLSDLIKYDVVANKDVVLDTYRRTVMNFWNGDRKKRRHAFRLLINAEQLKHTNTIQPRLTAGQARYVTDLVDAFDYVEVFKDTMYRVFN